MRVRERLCVGGRERVCVCVCERGSVCVGGRGTIVTNMYKSNPCFTRVSIACSFPLALIRKHLPPGQSCH